MSGLNNKKYLDGDGLIKFWEICCANFPAKDGRGATGTWPINITGNAKTATNAVTAEQLGSSAGTTTKPVYFKDGKPEQCNNTLDVSITGNAGTTNELNIGGIGSETIITETGVRAYSGNGVNWSGDVSSMAYAGVLSFGTPSRGWQLWASREGANNKKLSGFHFRTGKNDQTGWGDEHVLLDSYNFDSYAPKLDGTGATGTWPISISGNAGGNAATATTLQTTRKIWGQNFNGGGDVSGNMTGVGSISMSSALTLTGTEAATAAIKFSRSGDATWNYIIWPGSSSDSCKLAFGYDTNDAGSFYYMTSNAFYPRATDTYSLGMSSLKWSNVYATTFTGNLTGTADKVVCAAATSDADRCILVTNGSNSLHYSTKVKLNYSTGNVTAPTFTGNLIGNANSATTADTADKLSSNAGTATKPVYFNGGVPVQCDNTLDVSISGKADTATIADEAKKTTGTLTLTTPLKTETFNGSTDVTIEVTPAKLGLTKAVLYLGKSTTAITDGGTEKPTIDGTGVVNTLTAGNIVIDSADSREYIWNGSKWEKFGLDGDAASGNYKPIQAVVGDPTASGNATAFIDAISQDANGKITVTKKNVGKVANATLADNATKLATARTIWGQSFDGTSNIENASLVLWQTPSSDYTGGWARDIGACDKDGNSLGEVGFNGSGNSLTRVYIGKSWDNTWVNVLPSGNVGIGTTSPSEKLEVNGNVKATKFIGALEGNVTGTASENLPLTGGTMNSTAYIAWNTGADGNDISDWNTITSNGLRIISSTTTTSNAPTQYSTALHVKGRYGFQIASQGGEASSFYIKNIDSRSNNWRTIIHSGNIGSQSVASATNVSSFTAASNESIKRYVWMSWNDNTGKPAYSDKLTFQTSTNTLFVNDKAVSLSGHTHNFADLTNHLTSANEFNFIPNGYNKDIYFNYRAIGGTGTVSAYRFTNGAGTGGYALCYATNFITTSDRRMKENIKELQDCSKSLELGFYEFDYKTGGHSAGHIAQDVRGVYPAFVHGEETEKDNLSVDYNALHSVQIKALKDKVTTLENKNNDLKNRVEKLEALIKKLM